MSKYALTNIIKKSNDNWFSFLSGAIANIPITLMLTFDSVTTNAKGFIYLALYVLSIFVSLGLTILAFIFTIKKIDIKEKAKNKYEDYVANHNNVIVPAKYNEYLDIECKAKLLIMRAVTITFFVLLGLLVALIISLWVLKNFI